MTIHIFGAGIAGLTASHFLLEAGYHVVLYEELDAAGGFARSRREADNHPSEHSWRGFAGFYQNTFDIMKRIPTDSGTVFNNLSRPIEFLLPHDEITERGIDPKPTMVDLLVGGYYIARGLTSNKRREVYSQMSFRDAISGKVSKSGDDLFIKLIGPGLGLHADMTSIIHMTAFTEVGLDGNTHIHEDKEGSYEHKSTQGWHVLTAPTSEAWIDPWVAHLKRLGLDLQFGSKLIEIKVDGNKVTQCKVGNHWIGNVSDTYIFCVNPFVFKEILDQSNLLTEAYPELYKFKDLITAGSHAQPSFRLQFDKKINLHANNICFTFPDSEFNITLYPQENFFNDDPYFEGRGTLWSGTVCDSYKPGKLFGKPAIELTKSQLVKEITHQIMRSKELTQYIKENNDFSFNELTIVKSEIWHEWYDTPTGLATSNPKWVNTLNTYKHRPKHITTINNMVLGGAHTENAVNIWSMEGAVISGKRAAEYVTSTSIVNEFKTPMALIPFQIVDDLLYKVYLPQIIDIILFIIIIMIIMVICWTAKKIYKQTYVYIQQDGIKV